jgi:penicillin-insensitive murein DD-endopeptidase
MDIKTLLPEKGDGFVTFNRGDDGKFQFGQQSTIDATLATGKAWSSGHAEQPFSVGHISRKNGGSFDPPHKSHKLGVDIDVRPLRKDNKNQEVTITSDSYDQAATAELIALWWEKAPVQLILFNDKKVIAAGNSRPFKGHDNHFHIRLRMKDATIRIGDRGSDVAEVQSILGIETNGRFGPITQNAVEEFQESRGLNPDGIVGPKTWAALRAG